MNERYTRKNSLRLQGYDYRHARTFFVTICVEGRHQLFGEIANGEIVLNEFGKAVEVEWNKTAEIREAVSLDEYVIMPNHFHAILRLNDNYVGPYTNVGADGNPPAPSDSIISSASYNTTYPRTVPLSTIIAAFKRASTKAINELRGTRGDGVWQRSFFDRIIRNDHELGLARKYIVENPINWGKDKENPERIE